MPLEVINWIKDFVATNPVGATDPKSEGDDHIRGIKRGILANLPNLGEEAVRMSASQFNALSGMVAAFPFDLVEGAASGWLRCNGQAVLRADYPDLFALIGLIYGAGDGTTDFILPDYRGQFLRDQDDGALIDPDVLTRTDRGDLGVGDVVGSKQLESVGAHDHPVSDPGHTHPAQSAEENSNPGPQFVRCSRAADITLTTTSSVTGITVAPNVGAETRPINIYVRHYIHI